MSEAKEIESLAVFEEWLGRDKDYSPYHYSSPEPVQRRQVTDMTVAEPVETEVGP